MCFEVSNMKLKVPICSAEVQTMAYLLDYFEMKLIVVSYSSIIYSHCFEIRR